MLLRIMTGVAAAALAVGVTACSASTNGAAPASATAATAPTTAATTSADATTAAATPEATTAAAAPASGDRAAVEKTFADYDAALLARDFATACRLTAPEAAQALIKALVAQGAQVSTCEEAFTAVYAVPQASGPLDEAARSTKITDVVVSGDTATVTYSGGAGGQRKDGLTNKMRRTDGQWQLLGNDA